MRTITVLVLALMATTLAWSVPVYFETDEGRTVIVEISKQPSTVDTEEGGALLAWEPEDAARIVAAFQTEGMGAYIPVSLGGLRRPSDETITCLTLDLDEAGVYQIDVPGRVTYSPAGRVIWTAGQIEAIQGALTEVGREDALARIFGLRAGPPAAQPSGVGTVAPEPLKPKCGECLNGKACTVNQKADCCKSDTMSCMKCRVCIKVPALEGDLP